jgi:tryptophanyl-tRNA synthetase
MALDEPTAKMSKSSPTQASYVAILDEPDVVRRKIRRAKTDSGTEVKASPDKPAITNLLDIYASATGRAVTDLEGEYRGKGYGDLKKDLGEVVVETLAPIRERALELLDEPKGLDDLLEAGAAKARGVAQSTLHDAWAKMGLD